MPRRVLARLTCDAELRLAGVDTHGHPADVGRRTRQVPADLRRALQMRDRHCRFPGCRRTRRVHAHHVVHWAAGGRTDFSNLVLLCSHHHRFVHDRGWTLRPVRHQPGRWTFHAPGGAAPLSPVAPMPGASAEAVGGPGGVATAPSDPPHPRALQPPWWDGWYDLDETVRVVTEYLLDHAPPRYTLPPHPALAA
jgi:hypothetical protein